MADETSKKLKNATGRYRRRGGGEHGGKIRSRRQEQIKSKLVVRNLPYELTQEDFEAILEMKRVPTDCIRRFICGKERKNNRVPIPARVYLDMNKDPQLVVKAFQELPKYEFKNKQGQSVPMQIEYAPYQKFPRSKSAADPLENTIDQDPEYQQFVQKLSTEPQKAFSVDAQIETEATTTTATTAKADSETEQLVPLVQYLLEKQATNLLVKSRRQAKAKKKIRDKKKKKEKAATKGGQKQQAEAAAPSTEEASDKTTSKSKKKRRSRGSAWKKKKGAAASAAQGEPS